MKATKTATAKGVTVKDLLTWHGEESRKSIRRKPEIKAIKDELVEHAGRVTYHRDAFDRSECVAKVIGRDIWITTRSIWFGSRPPTGGEVCWGSRAYPGTVIQHQYIPRD